MKIDNGRDDRHSRKAMNLKTLRKKIRKLETRLQEGPAKLAKWKRKLAAMEKAKAHKVERKSAAQVATVNWRSGAGATKSPRKKRPSATSTPPKPAVTQENKPAVKAKRKLNLSPERRAQLAAAMKARWAAKRADEGNSTTSSDQNSPTPPTQPPKNKVDGF